jgi:helicase MOV-10
MDMPAIDINIPYTVAMTRAQALLIIVGDPNVLAIDPMWRAFLNYIHNNDGWKGGAIPWDPQEDEESFANPGRDLAAERRDRAQTDMDELVTRTRDLVLGTDVDSGDDAGPDMAWPDHDN